jgi:hypothetical protein
MISTETRRFRLRRGSSFLTHGGDNHDHRGLNRSRRRLDQALITEALADDYGWSETCREADLDWEIAQEIGDCEPVTFRLVLTTQVYENYGAHDWDGEGDCPQYWKAKGGHEYQCEIGNAMTVVNLGSETIQRIAHDFGATVSRCDNYWDEYVINWQLVASTDESYGEREIREMLEWGMIDEEQADQYRQDLKTDFTPTLA